MTDTSILIKPGTVDLKPCPFCGNDYLFYLHNGAVCCDHCQTEGPFADGHFDGLEYESPEFERRLDLAVRLWNARGHRAHEKAFDAHDRAFPEQ